MVSDFLDADWFKKYGEGLVNNESRLIDRLLAKPLPASIPFMSDWVAPGSDAMLVDLEEISASFAKDVFEARWGKFTEVERSDGLLVAVQHMNDHINHQMFVGQPQAYDDGWTSATYAEEPAELDIDVLYQTIRDLQQQAIERPYIEEIWFVDKDEAHQRFLAAFPPQVGEMRFGSFTWGTPVLSWNYHAEKNVSFVDYLRSASRVPLYGLVSGIWLKLSNGQLQEVKDVADMIAAFEAQAAGDKSG